MSISNSLRNVSESVLNYDTIIFAAIRNKRKKITKMGLAVNISDFIFPIPIKASKSENVFKNKRRYGNDDFII